METILRRTGIVVGLVLLVVLASWLPLRGSRQVDSLDIRTDGVIQQDTPDAAGPASRSASAGPVGGTGATQGPRPAESTGASSPPTQTRSPAPATRPLQPGLAQQVVTLVNQARSQAGCRPVEYDSRLAAAAQSHAADMAARGYFSHDSPEGVKPVHRVAAAGYDPESWTGENIARDFHDAQTVMQNWLGSPTNRAIILNCAARDIGMGVVGTNAGSVFWAQMFGAGD